jgi:hypothetical protein
MEKPPLPASLQAFLYDCIENYEQLELLVFLHRERNRWWTAGETAQQIGIPESLAAIALDDLVSRQLAERRPELAARYRYAPGSLELDYKSNLLARHYQENRFEIVKAMSANSIERLRTSALRTFAEAFVIRRDDKKNEPPSSTPGESQGADGDDTGEKQ